MRWPGRRGRRPGRVSAGTFTVYQDGRAELELATAVRTDRDERLGITREPDALDPARNGPSVAVQHGFSVEEVLLAGRGLPLAAA